MNGKIILDHVLSLRGSKEKKYFPSKEYNFKNRSVMNIVSMLNKEEQDEFFGHLYGINSVNQNKNHVSSNAMCFEKYRRMGVKNVSYMHCSLMLYYISQEDDFNSWYGKHSREGVDYTV